MPRFIAAWEQARRQELGIAVGIAQRAQRRSAAVHRRFAFSCSRVVTYSFYFSAFCAYTTSYVISTHEVSGALDLCMSHVSTPRNAWISGRDRISSIFVLSIKHSARMQAQRLHRGVASRALGSPAAAFKRTQLPKIRARKADETLDALDALGIGDGGRPLALPHRACISRASRAARPPCQILSRTGRPRARPAQQQHSAPQMRAAAASRSGTTTSSGGRRGRSSRRRRGRGS